MRFSAQAVKKFKMIYFLYGPDSYRSKEKMEAIIEGYKKVHKSGLNLVFFGAKEVSFKDFYDELRVSSMFNEKKLIILSDVFAGTKFQEDFLDKIKDLEILKDIVVIFENSAVDQRLKLFKSLVKNCKCQEFNFLTGNSLRNWIVEEIKKTGAKINPEALKVLLNYAGNDSWHLRNEIKKLASFKNNGTIRKEDVQLLVRPSITSDIFKTIDALAIKNKRQALDFLQEHMENGDSPIYLISMVAYQFKNLLVVKELVDKGIPYPVIIKKTGLHPFVVKKTYFQCGQFSLPKLKEIYHKIFKTDLNVKTGKVEPELALDLLISEI